MPSLKSSVLITGHPEPKQVSFGADFAPDLKSTLRLLSSADYPVLVLPVLPSHLNEIQNIIRQTNREPASLKVLVRGNATPEQVRQFVNLGRIFRVLNDFSDPRFDSTIQEALEEHALIQQNSKLVELVNEQNERLKKLTTDLEDRVQKRQKSLEEARNRLLTTNSHVEALHRAMVAIHQSTSVGEMEGLLNTALQNAVNLDWIRILFRTAPSLSHRQDRFQDVVSVHRAQLLRNTEVLGEVIFARPKDVAFARDEIQFLNQVADAIALAIDRLAKLEQSATLKQQWEATFDAIAEPLILIDDQYNLLRTNRSFVQMTKDQTYPVREQKCFQLLFGNSKPCEHCTLGQRFRLPRTRTASGLEPIFEVTSQRIHVEADSRALYVNMYRDLSAQLRLERQLLDSASMAELGTIGSSIAHELNNPLGGMLSFLQLIKMDLKGDESYAPDIKAMEDGAHKCSEIIKNLLGFTRRSGQEEAGIVDLREAVERALGITELQTRSIGIRILRDLPPDPVYVQGSYNLISQAIRNFLQSAVESIRLRLREERSFQPEIKVQVSAIGNQASIWIQHNGPARHAPDVQVDLLQTPDLGLNVAEQIVRDHLGRVEISAESSTSQSAKLFFPVSPEGQI